MNIVMKFKEVIQSAFVTKMSWKLHFSGVKKVTQHLFQSYSKKRYILPLFDVSSLSRKPAFFCADVGTRDLTVKNISNQVSYTNTKKSASQRFFFNLKEGLRDLYQAFDERLDSILKKSIFKISLHHNYMATQQRSYGSPAYENQDFDLRQPNAISVIPEIRRHTLENYFDTIAYNRFSPVINKSDSASSETLCSTPPASLDSPMAIEFDTYLDDGQFESTELKLSQINIASSNSKVQNCNSTKNPAKCKTTPYGANGNRIKTSKAKIYYRVRSHTSFHSHVSRFSREKNKRRNRINCKTSTVKNEKELKVTNSNLLKPSEVQELTSNDSKLDNPIKTVEKFRAFPELKVYSRTVPPAIFPNKPSESFVSEGQVIDTNSSSNSWKTAEAYDKDNRKHIKRELYDEAAIFDTDEKKIKREEQEKKDKITSPKTLTLISEPNVTERFNSTKVCKRYEMESGSEQATLFQEPLGPKETLIDSFGKTSGKNFSHSSSAAAIEELQKGDKRDLKSGTELTNISPHYNSLNNDPKTEEVGKQEQGLFDNSHVNFGVDKNFFQLFAMDNLVANKFVLGDFMDLSGLEPIFNALQSFSEVRDTTFKIVDHNSTSSADFTKRKKKVTFSDENCKENTIGWELEFDCNQPPATVEMCPSSVAVCSKSILKAGKSDGAFDSICERKLYLPENEEDRRQLIESLWDLVMELQYAFSKLDGKYDFSELQSVLDPLNRACEYVRSNFAYVISEQSKEYVNWMADIRKIEAAGLSAVLAIENEYSILIDSIESGDESWYSTYELEEKIMNINESLVRIKTMCDRIDHVLLNMKQMFTNFSHSLSSYAFEIKVTAGRIIGIYNELCDAHLFLSSDQNKVNEYTEYENYLSDINFLLAYDERHFDNIFRQDLNNLLAAHDAIKLARSDLEQRAMNILQNLVYCKV